MSSIKQIEIQQEFITKLKGLLKEYGAEIECEDHYDGYPECGQDLRMTVTINRPEFVQIDLGCWLNCKEK